MKLVVFDLDSTLIDAESLDEFGKLIGREKEISEITKKAMNGEISFEEALIQRTAFLKGLAIEKIYEAVKRIPLMKGARETVEVLKSHGIKTGVVSGGFKIVAEHIKRELNLDYAVANELVVEHSKITGEVAGTLLDDDSKGKAFEDIAKIAGISLEDSVAVGDGANDVSMLKKAGLAIAFNSKPVLNEVADVVIREKDLRAVLPYVLGELNMDRMLVEKDELDTRIKRLKTEISKNKNALKDLGSKRRELIERIRLKNSEANKFKEVRDRLNERVKMHKAEREALNLEVKKLVEEYKKLKQDAPHKDFKKIQKEKETLEWRLQTSVLDIKKEDALVERIEKLSGELKEYKELIELSDKIDEKRKASKKVHEIIVTLSTNSQQNHEKFLEAVNSIKELESKIDELNLKRNEFSSALEKSKEELKFSIKKSKELEKRIGKLKHSSIKDGRSGREQAKLLYERFKNGEKLTLNDIYLLQRFNLV